MELLSYYYEFYTATPWRSLFISGVVVLVGLVLLWAWEAWRD